MIDIFKNKFKGLNEKLQSAIEAGDFAQAQTIDAERQYLLVSFMKEWPDPDHDLIEFIEQCASENAELVTKMEAGLQALSSNTHRTNKMLKGYGG